MQTRGNKIITIMIILLAAVSAFGLPGCNSTEAVKPGRIIVINEALPAGSPINIPFSFSYGAQIGYPDGLLLRAGGQIDSGFTLPPGNYAVSETVPEGWALSGIVINDTTGGSFSKENLAALALAAGETITVKFSNTTIAFPAPTPSAKLGSIVLLVQTNAVGAPDSFDFSLSYGALVGHPGTLKLSGGQLQDSGFSLPPGNYSINQVVPTGWRLANIAINDASGGSATNGNMATISLAEGETVTVTYTNEPVKTGRIILMVKTSPDGVAGNFAFNLSYGAQIGYPDGLLLAQGQLIDSGFKLQAPLSYSIKETVPDGWQLTKVEINVGNSGKPYVSSLTTPPQPYSNYPTMTQATIGLGEGETVVVTFYNTRGGLPPTTATTTRPPATTTTPYTTPATTPANLGRIIVRMQTNPPGLPDSFNFSPSYGNQTGYPNGWMMRDGQVFDSGYAITPGTYGIIEYLPVGWSIAISINDPTGGSSWSSNVATINLAAGETVTVTFINGKTLTTTPAP
jgi:hypothetical protein